MPSSLILQRGAIFQGYVVDISTLVVMFSYATNRNLKGNPHK
jgi:hypothetical protein